MPPLQALKKGARHEAAVRIVLASIQVGVGLGYGDDAYAFIPLV